MNNKEIKRAQKLERQLDKQIDEIEKDIERLETRAYGASRKDEQTILGVIEHDLDDPEVNEAWQRYSANARRGAQLPNKDKHQELLYNITKLAAVRQFSHSCYAVLTSNRPLGMTDKQREDADKAARLMWNHYCELGVEINELEELFKKEFCK